MYCVEWAIFVPVIFLMHSIFKAHLGVGKLSNIRKYGLFLLILMCIWIFYFIICYYQMPVGDDLLTTFEDSYLHYVDGSEWIPEGRIDTLQKAILKWMGNYFNFNGRITGLFSGYILYKCGWKFTAFVSATIYTFIILLVGRIGLTSWEKIIKSPALLLLISVYLYQLTPTGTYICMWTFVNQYALPLLLYLIYYMLVVKLYRKQNLSLQIKFLIILLGFIAGACHECLGVLVILMTGMKLLYEVSLKKVRINRLWINSGFYLGYMVILFAPANFKRALTVHDSARLSTDIVEKLKISIYEHLIASGVLTRTEIWMVIIFIGLIIVSLYKKRTNLSQWIWPNIEFFSVIVASIPLWAIFAPPVPQYGLQFWKVCLIIFMLRAVSIEIWNIKIWNIIGISALLLWLATNVVWVTDLVTVTKGRITEIEKAKERGNEVVVVQRYPDTTYNYLTMYNIANQNQFDNALGEAFYGIRIIIEDGK